MRKSLFLTPFLFLSAQAFAWYGGARPDTEPKIPADISHNGKTELSNGSVIVEGKFSNKKGDKTLICDIYGEVKGSRGGDVVTIAAYVDKRVVKPYRSFSDRFQFDVNEAGPGYKLIKSSQKYEASCLLPHGSEEPKPNPDHNPAPHDSCDPEYEDCDWTCSAHETDADRCKSSNDW